jgi:hypothetical protein
MLKVGGTAIVRHEDCPCYVVESDRAVSCSSCFATLNPSFTDSRIFGLSGRGQRQARSRWRQSRHRNHRTHYILVKGVTKYARAVVHSSGLI